MQERIVYIRRVEKNDKTRLPKDLLMDSKKTIGPSFDKFGQVLKGITGTEEKALMPEIIGVSVTDPTFSKQVEEFWKNISINIPSGSGTKLNITVVNEVPVAPLDYIKYKFALRHKSTVEESNLDSNPYALYYIHDPASAKEKSASLLKVRNEAKMKYLELIQDTDKVDAVVSVMTRFKNPASLTPNDKELLLEELSVNSPQEFIATVKDETLTLKSFIYRCINAGVFVEAGTRVICDGNIIGQDMLDAVAYLKSKAGNQIYVQAQGKLTQWETKK